MIMNDTHTRSIFAPPWQSLALRKNKMWQCAQMRKAKHENQMKGCADISWILTNNNNNNNNNNTAPKRNSSFGTRQKNKRTFFEISHTTLQDGNMKIIVSQSEWSTQAVNLLCHSLLFRCLNPDWIKCGQVSLHVSATRKSSDSYY